MIIYVYNYIASLIGSRLQAIFEFFFIAVQDKEGPLQDPPQSPRHHIVVMHEGFQMEPQLVFL